MTLNKIKDLSLNTQKSRSESPLLQEAHQARTYNSHKKETIPSSETLKQNNHSKQKQTNQRVNFRPVAT